MNTFLNHFSREGNIAGNDQVAGIGPFYYFVVRNIEPGAYLHKRYVR